MDSTLKILLSLKGRVGFTLKDGHVHGTTPGGGAQARLFTTVPPVTIKNKVGYAENGSFVDYKFELSSPTDRLWNALFTERWKGKGPAVKIDEALMTICAKPEAIASVVPLVKEAMSATNADYRFAVIRAEQMARSEDEQLAAMAAARIAHREGIKASFEDLEI